MRGTGQWQGTGQAGSWTMPGTGQCEGQVSGRGQGSLVAGLCQGQVIAWDRSVSGDRAVR